MKKTVVKSTADVVICGAGIAGISAAYHLTVQCGVPNVVLVDERAPLTLTSDKSTEAYRNWWPGPDDAMIRLMNRSIDILEELARESDNRFLLNRRGYVYATADPGHASEFKRVGEQAAAMGAGPLRVHTGNVNDPEYVPAPAEKFENQPVGADLLLDQRLIREHFPYLAEETVAVMHTRRCGWFSGQQMGMYLLECARERGITFLKARVEGVTMTSGRVQGVRLSSANGSSSTISTGNFVNAAGPMLREVGALVGIDLPVFSERHIKAAFRDHLGVLPRSAPLLIWDDPQALAWTEEERGTLAQSEQTGWMLEVLPPGVHTRPEGSLESENILILWPYHTPPTEEVFPLPEDPLYPEIVMRGMAAMIPGLNAYVGRLPRPYVDGGYYTRTRENRLLSCPLPVEGAYVIGALAGYGLMAACAAGEILAAHMVGEDRPTYAPAFSLERYEDPTYQKLLENWVSTGQL